MDILDPLNEQHLDKRSLKDSKESFEAFYKKSFTTYESLMKQSRMDRSGFNHEIQKSQYDLDKKEYKAYERSKEDQEKNQEIGIKFQKVDSEEHEILGYLKKKTKMEKKKSLFKELASGESNNSAADKK